MQRRQVLVIGGGPVGLTTALGLARSGVEVTVVERETAIGTSPRAMAHMYPTVEGFDRLGVREDIEARALLVKTFCWLVWETGERIEMANGLPEGTAPFPYNLALGQDQISEVFLDHLSREPSAEVRSGTTLVALEQDATGVTATLRSDEGEQTLVADWVVGADGAGSSVRRLCEIPFEGMTWPDRFVATNVLADFPALGFGDANFCLDPVYGGVVARCDGTSPLWRYTYRESEDLPAESYAERIPATLEGVLRGLSSYELVSHSPYRMHQRCAASLRSGRVLLAGDAGHATNPIGGLGLTSGFLDAFVLYEALAAVVHGTVDDGVLDEYARLRREVFFERTSPTATSAKQTVFATDPVKRRADIEALRAVSRSPQAQKAQLLGLQALVTPSLVRTHEKVTA